MATADAGSGNEGSAWSPGGWLARPLLATAVLFGLAALILVLRVSADGLWDPYEVRLLELLTDASNPIEGQPLSQPISGYRSRILLWPLALGLKTFGVNELGARVPMVGLALLTLVAILGFATWLRSRITATAAACVMLTAPLFFISARLASQTLLPILAQVLAVWGLALLALPRRSQGFLEPLLGLALSGLGLVLGTYAVGTLLGVALPAGAIALSWMMASDEAEASSSGLGLRTGLVMAGLGLLCGLGAAPVVRLIVDHGTHSLPTAAAANTAGTLGLRLQIAAAAFVTGGAALFALGRRALPLVVAALAFALAVLPSGPAEKAAVFSPWLAGGLHWPASRDIQVDTLLRGLGFALFPWSALLPAAIVGRFSLGARRKDSDAAGLSDRQPSARFGVAEHLPLCWFALGYLLLTLHQGLVGDVPFVALPAIAVLLGSYLEDLLRDDRAGGALAAVCTALCVVIVGRDLLLAPEQLLASAFTESLRWPPPLSWVGQALMAVALLSAAAFAAALWAGGAWRRRGVLTLLGLSLVLGAAVVHGLCPQLSQHVSYRGLYTRYQQLGGGKLALFSVQQASGKIYGQNSTQLYTLPELMQFLAGQGGERTFAIVGSNEMGGIDREAHLRGLQYFVIDDSNAQYVLLSNRLLPGEHDLNPLRRFVSSQPPQPRVPLQVVFDERIELVGYDAPPEIARGEELVIRLYYRVLNPVSTNYKVFLHFDGSGARWNGDHSPVGGKFQTSYWSPGTYITDEHRMPVGRMSQAPGYYQIFTGFWPGGDGPRLTVTTGPHEADQRVRIGAIRVK